MRTGRFNGRDITKEVAAKHCRDARFIWLEAAPSSLISGQIKQFADEAGVKPVRIPGYGFGQWGIGAEMPLARDDEKIVLHFHGGAYVVSDLDKLCIGIPTAKAHIVYSLELHIPKISLPTYHVD